MPRLFQDLLLHGAERRRQVSTALSAAFTAQPTTGWSQLFRPITPKPLPEFGACDLWGNLRFLNRQGSNGTRMLYVVEIERERADLAKVMSGLREWLDGQRFEPASFRCATTEESATFRLEFKIESEAVACASAFGGQVSSIGDTFLAS
jgi:hypothetical protein